MKLKTTILYLFTFAFLAMPNSFAENAKKKMTNSQKAEMILKKYYKNKISYKASLIKPKYKYFEWVKSYQDNTYSSRVETISYEKGKKIKHHISLIQRDGSSWDLIDNIAIKKEYKSKWIKKALLKRKMNKKPSYQYKIQDAFYQKIQCYKITKKHFDDSLEIYYIDKKDYFSYGYESYSKSGKQTAGKFFATKKTEKMDPSKISDTLFQIPPKCRIIIADSFKDYPLYTEVASVLQKKRLKAPYAKIDERWLLKKYKVSDLRMLLNKKTYKKREINKNK